ncbi:uncharacterized protein [Dermacentor andersoni]|uniref:uncharacterized protein n=1 Tax=Dermacentor andersoni TaxID=34620 RepID=UPI002416E217|nr:uncharacterized protein LOC126524133 [Dermacentor andersoni]
MTEDHCHGQPHDYSTCSGTESFRNKEEDHWRMSQAGSSASGPQSPTPSHSGVELDRASMGSAAFPVKAGQRGRGSWTTSPSTSPSAVPLQRKALLEQHNLQQAALRGGQRLPTLAPAGRPEQVGAGASPLHSRGISSSDLQPLPSPFNSLLLLPSEDRVHAVPGDIRPDASWSLPQLCIGLCAMVAFLLAILFASTLAVRTLKHYDFLNPAAYSKTKSPPSGPPASPATPTTDREAILDKDNRDVLNTSYVALYAPALR